MILLDFYNSKKLYVFIRNVTLSPIDNHIIDNIT